ncbi:MAG: hypothetical protein IPK81_23855 [Rhodospirillales bacterium]|nr:MAG: hypothetical protein IPK81_23855 [Rhodospirillales bacterium]
MKDRAGNPVDQTTATVEEFIATDTVFAGTPDDVCAQIKDFNDRMGGVGHLLFFGQGGHLDHRDTVENITLFAKEVFPRLKDLNAGREATAGRPMAAE